MSGRGAMTMIAEVQRSPTQPTDGWGREEPPVLAAASTIACRAWSKSRREVRDDGKQAVVEDLRAIVPAAADVQEDDRLTIKDRLGATIFGGPVAVETITRRGQSPSGSAASGHLELMLTRHL